MAIVIEDLHIEQLAQQRPTAVSVTVREGVRESLLSLADIRGLTTKKAPLRERLATLAIEIDALPHQSTDDNRSDNDILGYDEHGIC